MRPVYVNWGVTCPSSFPYSGINSDIASLNRITYSAVISCQAGTDVIQLVAMES